MIDFIENKEDNSTTTVTIGNSDKQHIENLIHFCKGWHKFYPFVGSCLPEQISDETINNNKLYASIRQEIENDGATLDSFVLVPNKNNTYQLHMEATYG